MTDDSLRRDEDEFKYGYQSFLALLGDNSSLLDFDFLDILAEARLDSLDYVGLVSLEGEEVSSSSDFELGDLGVLLDEHGWVRKGNTLFGGLLGLVGGFVVLQEIQKFLGVLDFLGLNKN